MYRLTVILLLVLSNNCYCQNVFRIIGKSPKHIRVSRSTVVSRKASKLAERVIYNRSNEILLAMVKNQVVLSAEIEQPICRPEEVAGGYNYLKVVSRELRCENGWENIASSSEYNGAHHIINKSVLELIYINAKLRARQYGGTISYTLEELQSNAPAVFHPYHNHPSYRKVFHNMDRQLKLYYSQGVSGIIEDFFSQINEINEQEGLPLYDEEFIRTTLLEAALWAKNYGLFWKM